jgi:MFS family permease
MLTGAFMAIMDAFKVAISLPNIRADLNATFGEAQLVVAAYGLAYTVGLITGGRLGDLYGRKRMFMLGLFAFTLASLGCGLAPTPAALIAARIAQGLGAALMFPQVLSWMRVTFTDPAEPARAFAALGLTPGLGSVAGQIVGGLIVSADLWGWRPIFQAANAPGLAARGPGPFGAMAGARRPTVLTRAARFDAAQQGPHVRCRRAPPQLPKGPYGPSQHRNHCARRPRQDHARRCAPQAVRRLPPEPEGGVAGARLERPGARARHHHPGQVHLHPLGRHAHQHR